MQLTEKDKQKVLEWIREKCGTMRCMCCGTARFQLLDIATLPIGFNIHSTRFHYHEGIPQIGIACENCGHIIYFSSGVIGFRPDDPAKVEPK